MTAPRDNAEHPPFVPKGSLAVEHLRIFQRSDGMYIVCDPRRTLVDFTVALALTKERALKLAHAICARRNTILKKKVVP